MTTPEEGTDYLDVRSRWQNEAWHFTPWLARNLGMLSAALEVKLQLVQVEKPVGPFFCDILAEEVDTGERVAIENQLEWTDHTHLTQLLTYAAGLDARLAVWVAPEFRYEHAEALHWLNRWTHEGLRFYGVKVMLQKTGSGPPEPHLLPVVTPHCWNTDITQPPGATISPRGQQFHAFFQPLIAELCGAGFADKAINHFDSRGRRFPSRRNPDIGYAVSLEGENDAWVTLHISTAEDGLTKRIFDELERDKEAIEASIALGPVQKWRWHRHSNYSFSSINARRDGSIDDPPEKLDETRAWMLDLLPKFKEVFDPRVADILKELRAKRAG